VVLAKVGRGLKILCLQRYAGPMAPLIFTAELCERGEKLDVLSPLVLQWAGAAGPAGERLRDIPPPKDQVTLPARSVGAHPCFTHIDHKKHSQSSNLPC
jgi:hypothetical protein